MPRYAISMPVTGFIYKEIVADSEEEATEKFRELDLKTEDIEDWDICEKIVEGNVFHGMQNEVNIEQV